MESKNLKNDDNSNFIKNQRRARKLSIYEVALRLSLSKQQVIKYEKGLEPIPDNVYKKLKKILEF